MPPDAKADQKRENPCQRQFSNVSGRVVESQRRPAGRARERGGDDCRRKRVLERGPHPRDKEAEQDRGIPGGK